MLKELVIKNRSYRRFDETKPISRETLTDIVDTARLTPSSVNIQPLKYYISFETETNAIIRPLTHWAKALKNYNGPQEGENPTAYIIICVDTDIAPNVERFDKDVGISAQTLTLAAAEKGLGCCMIGNYNADSVSKALNLAGNLTPRLIVALGVPSEEIILEVLEKDQPFNYYRDENNVHHVPKRKLENIII